MQESAKKRRHYKKKYFWRNWTTTKQCKFILKKNKESKEIRDT